MSETMRIPILVFMLRQDTKSKIDYVMYLFILFFLSVNGLMSVFLRSLDHYDRSVLYHCQHEANTWYLLPVDPRLSVYAVLYVRQYIFLH